MLLTRAISLTNFFVATSALGFQVFVLYPWHKQLDDDFEDLKKEHRRVLYTVQGVDAEEKRKGIREWLGLSWSSAKSVESHLPSSTSAAIVAVHATKKTTTNTEGIFKGILPYARYAAAGGVCCSLTHAVLTPIDVVKTRIQLEPAMYNHSLFPSLRQVATHEGPGALFTGFGPTLAGYFLQGSVKFGGYEFFKHLAIDYLGYDVASKNRHAIYLFSAAIAESLADVALCPFEAVRIRLVSEPTFARGVWGGFSKMAGQEGISGFYSGLSPILLKQVPYTMASFVVYEKAIELAYRSVDKSTLSNGALTGINLGSGLIAGLVAALVSQPADTVLSKINKEKSQPGERTLHRLVKIASELGIRGSYSGIRARMIMVGSMTAVQFAIYGDVKKAIGAGDGIEIV